MGSRRVLNLILIISIIANVLVAGRAWVRRSTSGGPASFTRASALAYDTDLFEERLARFRALPAQPVELLILGDSMPQSLFVDLLERRNDQDINPVLASIIDRAGMRSRAIPSSTTEGMLKVAEDAIRLRPRRLLIWCGTNDTSMGVAPDRIVANIRKTVDLFRGNDSSVEVMVLQVFPVAVKDRPKMNDEIASVNALLRELSETYRLRLIDAASTVRSGSGSLAISQTSDGVHLRPDALRTVEKFIIDAVQQ